MNVRESRYGTAALSDEVVQEENRLVKGPEGQNARVVVLDSWYKTTHISQGLCCLLETRSDVGHDAVSPQIGEVDVGLLFSQGGANRWFPDI